MHVVKRAYFSHSAFPSVFVFRAVALPLPLIPSFFFSAVLGLLPPAHVVLFSFLFFSSIFFPPILSLATILFYIFSSVVFFPQYCPCGAILFFRFFTHERCVLVRVSTDSKQNRNYYQQHSTEKERRSSRRTSQKLPISFTKILPT